MADNRANASKTTDPGFGTRYDGRTSRMINRDGSFNIVKRGHRFELADLYNSFIRMSWTAFGLVIVGAYFLLNSLFAVLYMLAGVENIAGHVNGEPLHNFLAAFFFSFQTFTTVGYGAMAPEGVAVNLIAAIEAMTGLISFALATGLIYGRFSKPKARILYSNKAIITPFKDGNALMFRMVNQRSNVLMELEARVMLSLVDGSGQDFRRNYYNLRLQLSKVQFLPLNWTLVHVIDETSPLYGRTEQQLIDMDAEILILIKAFDDSFGQVVHSRFSYRCEEVEWGVKFVKAFKLDDQGDVIMDIPSIHKFEPARLNPMPTLSTPSSSE